VRPKSAPPSFTCHPHPNHTCLYSIPSRKASPRFGRYLLRLPTKGWPSWVDLGGWPHTEINVPHRKLKPDTITHPSTNRARRRVTSLMRATPLALSQAAQVFPQLQNQCFSLSFSHLTLWSGLKTLTCCYFGSFGTYSCWRDYITVVTTFVGICRSRCWLWSAFVAN